MNTTLAHSITDYQILRHGVEHSDYFQGCGVSFTKFDHVATGIGDTEAEAFEDALEQIAMSHSMAEGSLESIEAEEWDERRCIDMVDVPDDVETCDINAPYWHVSIRYNLA